MFLFLSSLMNAASARRRCRAGKLPGQTPRQTPAVCKLFVERLEDRQCLSPVLLVSEAANNTVERYDGTTGQLIDTFVTSGSGGLQSPRGLGYGPDGNLYVSQDTVPGSVLRYNGSTGEFIDTFASAGGLNAPHGLVFGPDSNLYVCGLANNAVVRYDGMTGDFIDNFASGGGLSGPHDLAFGPDGNLYVTSIDTNSVERYDGTTGHFIDDFVPPGSGGLYEPRGLAFGPDGNLYVGEQLGSQRVLRYDGQTGNFIDVFIPTGSGGLNQPIGLAFGPDGNFYVSSFGTGQILRYDGSTGNFIDVFASGPELVWPTFLFFHDTGEGGPGAPSTVHRPALQATAHGQAQLGRLSAEFMVPQPEAALGSSLVSGDQPVVAKELAASAIIVGWTSQPEATSIPFPMLTARHTLDAVYEGWTSPLVDGLAMDVLR
jgi:DNA-binding beta-propeller fold protein YncE